MKRLTAILGVIGLGLVVTGIIGSFINRSALQYFVFMVAFLLIYGAFKEDEKKENLKKNN